MKDFARTAMGRRFFETDIPQLIRALERIADSLEQENVRENKRFLFEQKMAKKNNLDFRDNVEDRK